MTRHKRTNEQKPLGKKKEKPVDNQPARYYKNQSVKTQA